MQPPLSKAMNELKFVCFLICGCTEELEKYSVGGSGYQEDYQEEGYQQ